MTQPEIEAFLSICRNKSISKAAEELYISQSSLSLRLKTLEEALGTPLLLRGKGKREVILTAAGQTFYELALQYQDIAYKMETLGQSTMVEKLRISAINSVGNYLLPPVFDRFLEKYPRVQLTIQDMEAERVSLSIALGKTDIAFTTAKVETDEIVATRFLADPMTVICSADAAYPDTVTLKQLSPEEEVYVMWCAEQEYWHESIFGADAPSYLRLELMGQIPAFVSRPGKWAIVPQSVADSLAGTPGIRRCRPDFSIPDRTVYILRNRDNAETVNIHSFLETLREVLQEQGTQGLVL